MKINVRHAHAQRQTHTHQVIHVGFACRVDVLQELQQVEGVTVHQMDSYGQIRLVLEEKKNTKMRNIIIRIFSIQ